jgi:glutamyl-tRNA synthetase
MSGPRVRFAPSPSGYLHIGGARTALFNWLWARGQGGTFVLRIEDTDQDRSSIESVRAILDALKWLGLDWDEGPEVGGPHEPYFQSERKERYRQAAEELIAKGKAYRCYCSKEALDAARAALKEKDPKAQFVYPGTCRDRTDAPDLPHVVRFRTDSAGAATFHDKVFGTVSTPNSVQQDFVLVRSDGFPLYNLGCVVDDHAMGITLVARGRDHIGNTAQQVLLYEAFGWELPEFAHLPMMLSPKGEKLSKRHASVAVAEYRERGFTPMGVLNYLVRFGWSHGDQEIFSREQLIELFSWDRVNRSDGKFDAKKFADVAFEHLKRDDLISSSEYESAVLPFLEARGLTVDQAVLGRVLPAIRPRAHDLVEAAHALDYYFRPEPELDDAARKKFLTPAAAPHLEALADMVAAAEPFETTHLEEVFKSFVEERQIKMKDVAQPARVALTGRTASPPLFDVMVALSREASVLRLRRGAAIATAT